MDSQPTTRERLLDAAATLFARHGFRGAPVRAICDLARANPGAVSYHFGGKRQLYRAVLRRAAERIAAALPPPTGATGGAAPPLPHVIRAAVQSLGPDDPSFRLLLRDLAEGGEGAAEAAAPLLRAAFESALERAGIEADPAGRSRYRLAVLRCIAPAFLLLGAWPVLERGLGLSGDDRLRLLELLLEGAGAVPG